MNTAHSVVDPSLDARDTVASKIEQKKILAYVSESIESEMRRQKQMCHIYNSHIDLTLPQYIHTHTHPAGWILRRAYCLHCQTKVAGSVAIYLFSISRFE